MLRPTLFAAAALAFTPVARAADPDLSGNWILSYSARPDLEVHHALIRVEMKDGRPVASALARKDSLKVTGFEFAGGNIIKLTTSTGTAFEGTLGGDGKVALGSFGDDRFTLRARLTRTDQAELGRATARVEVSVPLESAHRLVNMAGSLRARAAAEKKKLTRQADAAQAEADGKVPGLLRETVAKHADTPFAADAATDLIRAAAKYGVMAGEAEKLLAAIETAAAPFGRRYVAATTLEATEALVAAKGLETAAVAAGKRLRDLLPPDPPGPLEARVLAAYKTALERSDPPGKAAALKEVAVALEKVERRLDAEYLAKVRQFELVEFAGRKDKAANQVAVLELFTGSGCPACVVSEVAADALQKAYKPTELVVIRYHLHLDTPDPLASPDAVARWEYYRKKFPDDVRPAPTVLVNGKPRPAVGGPISGAGDACKRYAASVEPLLEKTAPVTVAGKATRDGDRVDIAVEVGGGGGGLRLRLVLVEGGVRFDGGNGVRFHNQVARALPGGAGGVAVEGESFKHSATVDLGDVRKGLTKYLDDYGTDRPFPRAERPMGMKSLRVVALVQDEKTGAVVQAVQIDLGGEPGGE